MARIRQEDIETVRERTDIAALVQRYVALKKSGRALAGLCPFHTEKTPSFTVDPGKQVYYCFGCGVGGNAYSFLMAIENLTFPEAVERLATEAGIGLQYEGASAEDRRSMSRRQSLVKANEMAAELYHRFLVESSDAEEARRYLAGRAISKEAAETFELGFAPGYPDFLLRRMAREFSPEILTEAGLVVGEGRGQVRDRFRGRVIFPVRNLAGQVVGFGARLLAGDGPKYLNSPETPIYRKGEMLYNLHRAKAPISSGGRTVVVEGYTDVIALDQAGVTTAVATCGTALSEGHFRLLARFAANAVLAFDSDEAGAKAAERAYEFFERYPIEASVLVLPEGLDPADLVVEQGAGAFEELATGAVPLVEYMIRRSLRGHDLETPEGRTRAVQAGLPVVAGLDDPVRRNQYAGLLADLAAVSPSSVLLELDQASRRPAAQKRGTEPARTSPQEARSPAREVEKEALKLLLQHADISQSHAARVREEHFQSQRNRKAFAFLADHAGAPAELVEQARDQGLEEVVAELMVEPPKGDPTSEYAERVFSRLEEFFLTREINTMKRRLERLNPTKDTHAYDSLFGELIALEGERRRVRARAGEGA